PLLGRRATHLLLLDPVPRDHARCVASFFGQTSSSTGAPITSGVVYVYTVNNNLVILHEHGRPSPPSPFEASGTLYALVAAGAFLLLWQWTKWIERRVVGQLPVRRAVFLGFGVGSVLALPVAIFAGWLAEQMTSGEPLPPLISGIFPVRAGVYVTVELLVIAAVVARSLGAHRE